jgi:methyl-accepting chemotaxis protein-1 (serine sensor receptor)
MACAMLIVAIAGLFGIYQLNRAVITYAHVIEVDYAEELVAANISKDYKTQVQEWKNTLLRGKDPKQLEKYWDSFQKHEALVAANTRKLQSAMPTGEARALTDKFIQAHTAMGEGYRKGYQAFTASGFDPHIGDEAVKGLDRAASELLDQVGDKIMAGTAVAVAGARTAAGRAIVLSLSLMLVVSVAGVLVGVMISRSLTRRIDEARRVAETVAAGDLTSHIVVDSTDEVGQLLSALKAMNASLIQVVGTVRASSDSIATGSAQIATGNADLSQRTEEQASNLQQTAASMEELSSTVKSNADTARQATQFAISASAVAEKGGSVVGQVVNTMEAISASSKKISDIIGVIDGIAFQTNILALNAAVEAARAGEQGRGFAVVAGEVRSLAQRAAAAAKEIKSLINDSVEKVEAGSLQVGEAGRTMDDIVMQVRRVNDLIAEISHATGEQTQGISQVSDAVTQLDHVTQQNAALVEESAAAAESLSNQAGKLVDAVSVFRLIEPASRTAMAA